MSWQYFRRVVTALRGRRGGHNFTMFLIVKQRHLRFRISEIVRIGKKDTVKFRTCYAYLNINRGMILPPVAALTAKSCEKVMEQPEAFKQG